jgi:hypothetical protein
MPRLGDAGSDDVEIIRRVHRRRRDLAIGRGESGVEPQHP